jgi:uncharacterized membrane protein YhaH (DUF805 family)
MSSPDTSKAGDYGFQPFDYDDVLVRDEEQRPKKGEWERITRGRVRLTRRHDMKDSPEFWVIAMNPGWEEFILLIIFIVFIVGSFLMATSFIRARRSRFELAGGILCTVLTCVVITLWLAVLRSSPGIVHGRLISRGESDSYCDRCKTFRPPKTIHCNLCQVCVEHYDHHSPLFMKCIGKENRRIFNTFVTCMFVTCVVQIAFLVTAFALRKGSLDGLPRIVFITGLCLLCCVYGYAFLVVVFVVSRCVAGCAV